MSHLTANMGDPISAVGSISWKVDKPSPAIYRDEVGNTGTIGLEPTSLTRPPDDISLLIQAIKLRFYELIPVFDLAAGQDFNDGMESEFSRALESFLLSSGEEGVLAFGFALRERVFDEHHIAEALSWLSDLDDPATKGVRRFTIEQALESESYFIRDAAVSALSYLGDSRSIQALESLLQIEKSDAIKANIHIVLSYLYKLVN